MHTTYINDICINVEIRDLQSCKVKGCATPNEDGSYTIFLNSRFSYSQLEKTYKHELKHIINEDFTKYDVNEIEVYAH